MSIECCAFIPKLAPHAPKAPRAGWTHGRGLFDTEIDVDNFAGGGGVGMGFELATGKCFDHAINHDPASIEMHKANHPGTTHHCESVWDIDPVSLAGNHGVRLAWFSPDCKHFSRAKGSKPVEKKIRGLAWVVIRWAKRLTELGKGPRVIMLENVREFQDWGPLTADNMPDPMRKGQTFKRFVTTLENLGYVVQWRVLDAADYGAPTHRRRLFLIARSDGLAIRWPEKTHGCERVQNRNGSRRTQDRTKASVPGDYAASRAPRDQRTLREIFGGSQTPGTGYGVQVSEYGDKAPLKPYRTAAECIDWTIPCQGKVRSDVTRHRLRTEGKMFPGRPWIMSYYGNGGNRAVNRPLPTITTRDRFALVMPDGAMRMLMPRELARCQGFPDSYVLTGTQANQVARIGNSVPPPIVEALVRANLGDELRVEEAVTA